MPYVSQSTRDARNVVEQRPGTVGELTYCLQQLVKHYIDRPSGMAVGDWTVGRHNLSFQRIAEVTGALHQLQRDFDERIVEPYEAAKLAENGDVW